VPELFCRRHFVARIAFIVPADGADLVRSFSRENVRLLWSYLLTRKLHFFFRKKWKETALFADVEVQCMIFATTFWAKTFFLLLQCVEKLKKRTFHNVSAVSSKLRRFFRVWFDKIWQMLIFASILLRIIYVLAYQLSSSCQICPYYCIIPWSVLPMSRLQINALTLSHWLSFHCPV